MQNTLVKVGSKDLNTISQPVPVLRHCLNFVEFAEELTQIHSIPSIGDMVIGRSYYLVDCYAILQQG